MPEIQSETRLSLLESKMDAAIGTLRDLRSDLAVLFDKMGHLPIIEERYRTARDDIDKTLDLISDLRKDVSRYREDQQIVNERNNRWLYSVSGGVFVIGVLWTIFGSIITKHLSILIELIQRSQHLQP